MYWFQAWNPSQMQRSHRDLCIWDGFWSSSPILLIILLIISILILIIISILILNKGKCTNVLISSLEPVPNAEISQRSLHLGRFLKLQPNIINIGNINNIGLELQKPSQLQKSLWDLCIWDGFWCSSPILLILILILIIISILIFKKEKCTNVLISSLEPAQNAEISPRSLHLGRFLGLQPNIINIININNTINIKLK